MLRWRRDKPVAEADTLDALKALLAGRGGLKGEDAAPSPEGPSTSDRAELASGIRSFHIRHRRGEGREAPIANPALRGEPSGL